MTAAPETPIPARVSDGIPPFTVGDTRFVCWAEADGSLVWVADAGRRMAWRSGAVFLAFAHGRQVPGHFATLRLAMVSAAAIAARKDRAA